MTTNLYQIPSTYPLCNDPSIIYLGKAYLSISRQSSKQIFSIHEQKSNQI